MERSGYGGEGERSIRNLGGCTKSYTTTTTAWIWVSGGAPTIGRVGPGTAEKHQIVVFYQSSDLSLFPSDYTPGTIPAQTGTAGPSDSGSTPVETGGGGNPIETLGGQTLGGGTGGLSTGAKAGIGAGVAIGVLAVLGILFLFFQRRRRSARTKDLPEKLELDASLAEKRQGPVVAELHAHDPAAFPAGRHELHGTQIQKELDVPEELPAHLPPEMPGPDTVSPADLSPVELETAAPVPSATGRPIQTAAAVFWDPKPATEKPILASHRTQPGHSSPSGHFPLSPSELSSTSAAASASELSAQASGVQGMPTTIEELELQYLESEARRIQQRKEEILRERGGKTGEGS